MARIECLKPGFSPAPSLPHMRASNTRHHPTHPAFDSLLRPHLIFNFHPKRILGRLHPVPPAPSRAALSPVLRLVPPPPSNNRDSSDSQILIPSKTSPRPRLRSRLPWRAANGKGHVHLGVDAAVGRFAAEIRHSTRTSIAPRPPRWPMNRRPYPSRARRHTQLPHGIRTGISPSASVARRRRGWWLRGMLALALKSQEF